MIPIKPAITGMLFLACGALSAQHNAAFKFHTFRVLDGLFTFGYEQALSRHISAELLFQGGQYINVRPIATEHYVATGKGAIGSIRYYPFAEKKSAPAGFFGYASARYVNLKERYQSLSIGEVKARGVLVNIGGGVGYKFVYRRVGVEGFVGWGAGNLKSKDENSRQAIHPAHRSSIEEQEHFPQLDVAICYMIRFRRDAD